MLTTFEYMGHVLEVEETPAKLKRLGLVPFRVLVWRHGVLVDIVGAQRGLFISMREAMRAVREQRHWRQSHV